MQSFRTELELVNHSTKALVEKDIIDLDKKIREFRDGTLHEEKFRSLRLARGVYGQRQQGVQMIRIKLPFGKVSTNQLLRIAAISDTYSNGNLHLTTRQDIQIHYVSLDRTPELWAKLEQDDITLREACGNTVRNVTASAEAGIDKNEPFDVSPYAHAVFSYFLRKPFGQELGRKIKIAFSNNDRDTAVTYIHDIGFIPKINAQHERGFKVLIGGGLGAQPFLAQVAYEFLPENRLIPFIEATIRVFDRHGERVSRHKARIKYLVHKIGIAAFLELLSEEEPALLYKTVEIDRSLAGSGAPVKRALPAYTPRFEKQRYEVWLATNTFEQKQSGYHGVYVKVQLGNISSEKTRALVEVIERFASAADVRITINQGFLLKYVYTAELPFVYDALNALGLATPGFDSTGDITACPGTTTCNLGISNSTNIAVELENVIHQEYPELIYNHDIKIKISGCMNSCGQHGLAQIGFHGSSFKAGTNVVPALQLVLGGGTGGDGKGRIAEKVIKIASKRAPRALRILLDDFENGAAEGEDFNSYYDRQGKDYFYQLLKATGDHSTLTADEFYDWGSEEKFKTEIGVGECAGVIIDLVQTLFYEAEEKLEWSVDAFAGKQFGDSIYYSYAAFIHAAKGLLLQEGVRVNTHHALINDFDARFGASESFAGFKETVLQLNKNEPSEAFAAHYLNAAKQFVDDVKTYRDKINVTPAEAVK